MLLSTKASAGRAEEHLTPTTKLQCKCLLLCWWQPAVFTYEARENRTVQLWAHLKNRKSDDLKLPSWLTPNWNRSAHYDLWRIISSASSLYPGVTFDMDMSFSSYRKGLQFQPWSWVHYKDQIRLTLKKLLQHFFFQLFWSTYLTNAPAREITWLLCWLLFIGCP